MDLALHAFHFFIPIEYFILNWGIILEILTLHINFLCSATILDTHMILEALLFNTLENVYVPIHVVNW